MLAVSPASIGSLKSGGATTTDIYVGGRPTFLGPIGNTSDTTPTFTWAPVLGAASYHLTVNRINVPQVGIINQTSLTTTSFVPTTPLPVGTYRAWVRAVSGTGEISIWSVQVDFNVTETDPTGDITVGDLMLTSLLVSEMTQRDQGPVSAESSNRSALPAITDQRPDLPALDRMMAEFAMQEFSPGER